MTNDIHNTMQGHNYQRLLFVPPPPTHTHDNVIQAKDEESKTQHYFFLVCYVTIQYLHGPHLLGVRVHWTGLDY